MRMTYDRLVCANCAAPVSEGRCPVCRAEPAASCSSRSRARFAGLNPATLIALLVVLLAALALLAHQTA